VRRPPSQRTGAVVRRPRAAKVILTVAGRLGLAAGKGAILATIVWFVASKALESNASPYMAHTMVGAAIVFVLASIYFVIWPSPLGDPRSWEEIIHVPPPPEADDDQQLDERRPGS
jgi:hypothetical protein